MKLARFPPLSCSPSLYCRPVGGPRTRVFLTLILFIAVHGHFTHNDLLNEPRHMCQTCVTDQAGNRATLVGNAMPAAGNTATEF